jgi:hypothetical protein
MGIFGIDERHTRDNQGEIPLDHRRTDSRLLLPSTEVTI